jgi:hypothetical protein
VYQSTVGGVQGAVKGSPTTASFTDTTVTNGTKYFYTVRAVNASGESAASVQIDALPVFTIPTINVMRGQLLVCPSSTTKMSYVYIDKATMQLTAIRSIDGGTTWSNPVAANGSASTFDFAAALDGNNCLLTLTVKTVPANIEMSVFYSLPEGASAWNGTTVRGSGDYCRLPSVYQVSPNSILFGLGYDTNQWTENGANAYSLFWNGNNLSGPDTVNLGGISYPAVDNPALV